MAHSFGMEQADVGWLPPEIDTTVPHSARVYDYWLGGKDNFAADRALAESLMEWVPIMPGKVRVNRAFLGRVVRYLAREHGVRQFLDIGAGLPTARNTHEVAEEIASDTRVLYVDNDPIVVAHARALMVGHGPGQTGLIHADLREPDLILSHPTFAATLDLDEPVAVLMLAVLMAIADSDDPHGSVSKVVSALPPGSYLAITHLTADFDPHGVAGLVATAAAQGSPIVARSRAEVEDFFAGTDLIDPGVVPVTTWWPDGEVSPADHQAGKLTFAGVGRKPW